MYPVPGISLTEIKEMNDLLLKCGAPVHEINIIRKHLSKLSGGRLAKHLKPAKVISLIISDTLDTKYDATASGPTVADKSTFKMALDIIKKYNLEFKISRYIVEYLKKGIDGKVPETLKVSSAENVIIADNKLALDAMKNYAKQSEMPIKIISSRLIGNVKDVAAKLFTEINKIKQEKHFCLVAGGEPTVIVKGKGYGGRCQELTALMIEKIKNIKDCAFLAAGSDGNDFMPGIGGAIIDNNTFSASKKINFKKMLADNNSYEIHRHSNNLILTDDTGTNICDLMVFLK